MAEFEKQCLTSDVNLAEVASVHQILSLLGQKVQVPAEARTRMYQLVKGRETVRPKSPAGRRRGRSPEPVTKPIQPWVVPEPPKRPWIERFGPAMACLLLIMVCIFAAWRSLTGAACHPGALSPPMRPVATSTPCPDVATPQASGPRRSSPPVAAPESRSRAGGEGPSPAAERPRRPRRPRWPSPSRRPRPSSPRVLPGWRRKPTVSYCVTTRIIGSGTASPRRRI